MRRIPPIAALLLLAACGLNGTDRNEDEEPQPAAASGADEMASHDPAEGADHDEVVGRGRCDGGTDRGSRLGRWRAG